jgi:DNA-binding MarR family transcriptional regulator
MTETAQPILLDAETKVLESPEAHKDELRLWLRLLTCANMVESEVRGRLRERFEVTLPRFDLMAQLQRARNGMTLSEVSRRMMVSNGNVTGLVERLVESGHLHRWASPSDRRVQVIALTPSGRTEFARMAKEHENWIFEMFGAMEPDDITALIALLGKLKSSIRAAPLGSDSE